MPYVPCTERGVVANIFVDLDINAALNILTLALLIFGGPKILRQSRYKAQVEEREKIIDMKQETIDTLSERLELVREDKDRAITDAQRATVRKHDMESELRALTARYEEQSKYTAKEGFMAVVQLISLHNEDAQRRHDELIQTLKMIGNQAQRDAR